MTKLRERIWTLIIIILLVIMLINFFIWRNKIVTGIYNILVGIGAIITLVGAPFIFKGKFYKTSKGGKIFIWVIVILGAFLMIFEGISSIIDALK